jgi:hypothetical protein
MLEELFDKIADVFRKEQSVTTVVDGKTYAIRHDRTLGDYVRPPAPLAAPLLPLQTLTGLVAAYNANIDQFPAAEVAVQVESFDSVALVSLRADEFGRRHVWTRAKHVNENPFRFGAYLQIEEFLIALQAGFLPSDNVTALSRLCSSVTAGNSVSVADDGISQTVTVQEGAMQRGSVNVPSRLPLAPYRTFREIEPVASDFLLRMKPVKDNLPTVALLEVDGGKWRLDTVQAVATWLQANLPTGAVVIA